MPPSSRTRFIADIFAHGLPDDLVAMLGLTERVWVLLNVPTTTITATPAFEGLPPTIDAIAGPLGVPDQGELLEIEKRARWHYGPPDQEAARRRMATDLALSRGLLVPNVKHAAVVQFWLPCQDPQPDALGEMLARIGCEQLLVLMGADGDVERSGVTADDLVMRIEHGQSGAKPRTTTPASRGLQGGLHRIFQRIEFPRRLPFVVDLADQYASSALRDTRRRELD